jgi:hypothetical protein
MLNGMQEWWAHQVPREAKWDGTVSSKTSFVLHGETNMDRGVSNSVIAEQANYE